MENYLLSIPIYYQTEKDFNNKYLKLKQKYLNKIYSENLLDENQKKEISLKYDLYNSKPWIYNDICGWIKLYVLGSQLRGEISILTKIKISKNTNYEAVSESGYEILYDYNSIHNSEDILKIIIRNLLELQDDKRLRKYFLNLSEFNRISKYIDWKNLLIDQSLLFNNKNHANN